MKAPWTTKTIAMLNICPIWRMVLIMAEAMPKTRGSTEPITALVLGDTKRPKPRRSMWRPSARGWKPNGSTSPFPRRDRAAATCTPQSTAHHTFSTFGKATAVLSEMAAGKQDTDIPREMLARARAIAVFPGVTKGAVIVGGRHGQGVMSVKRLSDGRWSPPAFFTVGGGSFGLQLGGQVIDLPLLDPLFTVLGPQAADYRLTGKPKPRTGSRSTNSGPRNAYRTKDGRFVALSASTQKMAERVFRSRRALAAPFAG